MSFSSGLNAANRLLRQELPQNGEVDLFSGQFLQAAENQVTYYVKEGWGQAVCLKLRGEFWGQAASLGLRLLGVRHLGMLSLANRLSDEVATSLETAKKAQHSDDYRKNVLFEMLDSAVVCGVLQIFRPTSFLIQGVILAGASLFAEQVTAWAGSNSAPTEWTASSLMLRLMHTKMNRIATARVGLDPARKILRNRNVQIVLLGGGTLLASALTRSRPIREIRREHIPHVMEILKSQDAGLRLRAAELLFESATRFPEEAPEIRSSLTQRMSRESDGSPLKEKLIRMVGTFYGNGNLSKKEPVLTKGTSEKRRARSTMVEIDDQELGSAIKWILMLHQITNNGSGVKPPKLIDVAELAADDYLSRIPSECPNPHRSTVKRHAFDLTRDLDEGWITRKKPEGNRPNRDLAYQAFQRAIAEARLTTAEGELPLATILPKAYEQYLQLCPDSPPTKRHTFSLLVIGEKEDLDDRILKLLEESQVKKKERNRMDEKLGLDKLRTAREEVLSGRYPEIKPMTPVGNQTVCQRARELYGDNAPSLAAFRKLIDSHPELKIDRIPRRSKESVLL